MSSNIVFDALTDSAGRMYALIILLCLIGLVMGLTVLWLAHRGERRGGAVRDDDGTATIEFALVFPILLFMMLVLSQTTFLMAGNIFVHYAAFAATRSAIVQIPTEYPDDPANVYTAGDGRTKHEKIWRSAVFAVAPVGGEMTSGNSGIQADQFVEGLRRYYSAYGRGEPAWVENLAGDRLRYAAENTAITVMAVEVEDDSSAVTYQQITSGSHEFEARDPIAVAVRHRFALDVPYVNRIYADGELPGGGRYALMGARYTLTNEGVRDELPPQPTVPRQEP